jgi:hypothetical protein
MYSGLHEHVRKVADFMSTTAMSKSEAQKALNLVLTNPELAKQFGQALKQHGLPQHGSKMAEFEKEALSPVISGALAALAMLVGGALADGNVDELANLALKGGPDLVQKFNKQVDEAAKGSESNEGLRSVQDEIIKGIKDGRRDPKVIKTLMMKFENELKRKLTPHDKIKIMDQASVSQNVKDQVVPPTEFAVGDPINRA